jgi:tetratricopeptide (TPR) repeat protein
MRWLPVACCSFLFLVSTANAEWLEASSDHFVIYGDQNEKSVRGFAERLELFHEAMAHVLRRQSAKTSPSNRVTIYVVTNQSKVREFAKADNQFLAGVYIPRAGSTIALVPKLKGTSSEFDLSAETILFHEYAHYFMAGLTARAYPSWFVEGFAEFFSGVQFKPDSVGLGAPATHRAYELAYSQSVPIRKMLDIEGDPLASKPNYDAFYGQSWALFHYLEFSPERAGQLAKYEQLLATGDSALEAAEGAFGDLDKLEKDMQSYPKRRKLSYLVIDRKALTIGPIIVRALSPGQAEMMPTTIRSKVGVTHEEALGLLPEAHRVAAHYPDDPEVLAALAEAEVDAGNDDAAIVAADRCVAIDPKQINAQIQKGYALIDKIHTGALPKESWRDVRSQFMKVNRIENDNPIPLVQFYLSYLGQGVAPTKNAIDGLEWAMALAPFDSSVRWLVAQQMIFDNRLNDAAQTLAPLAYSPHPGEQTDMALKLLKDVKARIAAAQGSAAN